MLFNATQLISKYVGDSPVGGSPPYREQKQYDYFLIASLGAGGRVGAGGRLPTLGPLTAKLLLLLANVGAPGRFFNAAGNATSPLLVTMPFVLVFGSIGALGKAGRLALTLGLFKFGVIGVIDDGDETFFSCSFAIREADLTFNGAARSICSLLKFGV